MKKFLFAVCLVCVISKCLCSLSEDQNNTLPVKPPNTCASFDGKYIGKNEIIPAKLGSCYGIRCNSTLGLEDELCGVAIVRKGCHGRSFDLSLPYPQCCPSEVCKT